MSGPAEAHVEAYISTQSVYCYLLFDRLLELSARIEVRIRPVLGGVLRLPGAYAGRSEMEARYFVADSARTAEFLGLPLVHPDPSPIAFDENRLWTAKPDQPRNKYLQRVFVGAVEAGCGPAFLDRVLRRLWDGSLAGWDRDGALAAPLGAIGLDLETLLADMSWPRAQTILERNAEAMYAAGHWGVPLMVFRGEPFYGQDRFDQLLWRIETTNT